MVRRSEADSDIPAASSHVNSASPRTGFFNLASREPCQPVSSSGNSSLQSASDSSSDSVVRTVLLPDFSGPTAVSSANTVRRTNNQTRPPLSGSSLLRSRLCASAASSSSPAAPDRMTNAAGASVTGTAGASVVTGGDAAVSSGASAIVTNVSEVPVTSITNTNAVSTTVTVADNTMSTSQSASTQPAPILPTNRPSLLRSFLSVPSASAPPSATITTSADSAPSSTPAASSSAPLVIFGRDEISTTTATSNGSSGTGQFNFTQNLSSTPSTVSNSEENNAGISRSRSDLTGTERHGNDQADESSPGSPEPGSSCPDQCNICSGMPGTRESFALHRMRNRRRRMMMRRSVMGRSSTRRSGNPAAPPRERTQTLASYIDSEVRRVLGQQNSQESDSSDSNTERSDAYQQPTALIMPPSAPQTTPSAARNAETSNAGTDSIN